MIAQADTAQDPAKRGSANSSAGALRPLPLADGNGDGDNMNKQDALGKRTYTGFNARWDAEHP